MQKTILFSPVGMTDPIRYFHDGAMLNIIRNYKPDIVYMYMSEEIVDNHRTDNRYVYSVNKLAELLGKEIEIKIAERPELKDVQLFDGFLTEFTDILNEIHREYPDVKLLLNVSSGTPAMKSSLQILSLTLDFPTVPIQVSTPQKKSNPRIDDEKDASPEELWELNESNTEQDNRCVESETKNLLTEFKKQSAIKLIRSYDYAAAYQLVREMELPEDFLELLDAANSRLKLDHGKTAKVFEKHGSRIRLSENKEFETVLEYILLLHIKTKKQEYADFMRAITPVIAKIFEIYLREKCRFDLNEFTKTDRKGVRKWDLEKLQGTPALEALDAYSINRYGKPFESREISTDMLCLLICDLSSELKAKELAKELRDNIEQKLRNSAAHTIVRVTENDIIKETGYRAEEIVKKLIDLSRLCGMNITGDFTDTYDKMNKIIIDRLK